MYPLAGVQEDLPVVGVLATVGVVLAAIVTATGMHQVLDWDWGSAIIFGVLIAATDPVSVIATFKEAGVVGRLRLLIEAESLLNDGTAAVAFVAVLGVLAGGQETVLSITGTLLVTIVGGVLIGGVVALGFMLLAGRTRGLPGRDYVHHAGGLRLLFCGRALSLLGRARGVDGGLGRGELSPQRSAIGRRSTRVGNVLGIPGLYRQFVDLHFDRRAGSGAAFRRISGGRCWWRSRS